MNCSEFQYVFDNATSGEKDDTVWDGLAAVHLASCEQCRQWLELRRQLGRELSQLRETIPQPSAAMEAMVMAGFRQFHASAMESSIKRTNISRLLWRGALAAAIAAVIFVALATRRIELAPRTTPIEAHSVVPAVQRPAKEPMPTVAEKKQRHRVAKKVVAEKKRRQDPVRVAVQSEDQQPVFRSLMYCDPLSCAGPMEVVRMPLPAAPPPMPSGAVDQRRQGYAEFLVGEDGVARAMRLVSYPN